MKTNKLVIDRRSMLRGAAWSGMSLWGLFSAVPSVMAAELFRRKPTQQPSPGKAAPSAEGASLDAGPGRVTPLSTEELGKFTKLDGKESETFGVSLPNGERHLFRVSQGEGNAALVESVGPRGERHSVSIPEGDSPLPHLEKKQGETGGASSFQLKSAASFWGCWVNSFVGKVGQAIWNNIRNNCIACWNAANKKNPWWKKLASFLSCICNVPYATYAVQAYWACK